jgi:hypothetical protein
MPPGCIRILARETVLESSDEALEGELCRVVSYGEAALVL